MRRAGKLCSNLRRLQQNIAVTQTIGLEKNRSKQNFANYRPILANFRELRLHNTVETAFVRVQNDILQAIDNHWAYCSLQNEMERNAMEQNEME